MSLSAVLGRSVLTKIHFLYFFRPNLLLTIPTCRKQLSRAKIKDENKFWKFLVYPWNEWSSISKGGIDIFSWRRMDSPKFFQPQRSRHSWLWISPSSRLDYLGPNFSPLCTRFAVFLNLAFLHIVFALFYLFCLKSVCEFWNQWVEMIFTSTKPWIVIWSSVSKKVVFVLAFLFHSRGVRLSLTSYWQQLSFAVWIWERSDCDWLSFEWEECLFTFYHRQWSRN